MAELPPHDPTAPLPTQRQTALERFKRARELEQEKIVEPKPEEPEQ